MDLTKLQPLQGILHSITSSQSTKGYGTWVHFMNLSFHFHKHDLHSNRYHTWKQNDADPTSVLGGYAGPPLTTLCQHWPNYWKRHFS